MDEHLRLLPRLPITTLLVPIAVLAMLPVIILLAVAYYIAVAVWLVSGGGSDRHIRR